MIQILKLQKYDPQFFDQIDGYTKNEWTEVSDIGRSFEGHALTCEEYIEVEESYLDFLDHLMECVGIDQLQVVRDSFDIEDHHSWREYTFGIPEDELVNFKDHSWLGRIQIRAFARLALRGLLGFALTDRKGFFFMFTGEFYVHIGMDAKVNTIYRKSGRHKLYLVKVADYDSGDPSLEDYKALLPDFDL